MKGEAKIKAAETKQDGLLANTLMTVRLREGQAIGARGRRDWKVWKKGGRRTFLTKKKVFYNNKKSFYTSALPSKK